jgi:exonuclease SbcC
MTLLRSITLKNIRSYNDGDETRLDFPDGVILLEGDVGSGKSTLLYALEFALFGFSDMKGSHLLSEGRKDGRVSVTFEASGKEYTVDRALRAKGGGVTQDECHISSDGQRARLSPSDLKERVVSILGFNEPTHPGAESLVYRYAVFTPQEQMKDILVQNPEERLHVIRRVLGAQSYQVAAENSEIVERGLKESAYGLKKASEDLEEKENDLRERMQAKARLDSEIPRLERDEAESTKAVRGLESEWKESLGLRESLAKSERVIPLLKRQAAELEGQVRADETKLGALEAQLSKEVESTISSFEAKTPPASGSEELERRLAEAREELARITGLKAIAETELLESRELLSRGVCPVCGQKVSGELPALSRHSDKEVSDLASSAEETSKRVLAISESLEAARKYEEDEKDYGRAVKDRARVEREIDELRRRIRETASALSQRESELKDAEPAAGAIREVSRRISELEARLEEARGKDRLAGRALAKARQELSDNEQELKRLSEEVRKKRMSLEEARRLGAYQTWLSAFFRPTIQMIEEETLSLAAARFNEHFQRFFAALVDDPDMSVRVDESFSPLFEREGFEQEYEALSGGERTSMALAYRFALNSIVKESGPTQSELVILDEPTDGFSKEQVYKMRSLLDELDSRQVILVSHEKELESLADHIFKVEKRNGTSSVSGD